MIMGAQEAADGPAPKYRALRAEACRVTCVVRPPSRSGKAARRGLQGAHRAGSEQAPAAGRRSSSRSRGLRVRAGRRSPGARTGRGAGSPSAPGAQKVCRRAAVGIALHEWIRGEVIAIGPQKVAIRIDNPGHYGEEVAGVPVKKGDVVWDEPEKWTPCL